VYEFFEMSRTNDETYKEKKDDIIKRTEEVREKWREEEEDDTDRLLNDAIAYSLGEGKGWAPGEREEYLETILDDDFIPPLFAGSQEELEASGLSEAFSSLEYDEPPAQYMLDYKKKGNDAFMNGKRNEVKNHQFYRDAINHYYEAFSWAQRVEFISEKEEAKNNENNGELCYTENELDEIKSVICANAAMAHMQLKNWGHVRDDSKKALTFNKNNIKAWYRFAKAHQSLQNWEEAGDAIDTGLGLDPNNKDLKNLEKAIAERVRRARLGRQRRERKRAERVSRVKNVWKWCKESGIKLGRVPLVTSVTDDHDGDEATESIWHHHHPHTGKLPEKIQNAWCWPCMFIYPSHNQSDFIQSFSESDILAMHMAEIFPELENEDNGETAVSWDYKNEFRCSNLVVYFEVHRNEGDTNEPVHPESVEILKDQASTMKFYEASRALKGDEGDGIASLARALERKHLYKQQKAWKQKHGSLWAKPNPAQVLRVHPATTLRDLLTDKRMVVPNFLVSFTIFPEKHPAHDEYLKEHKCVGLIQPPE